MSPSRRATPSWQRCLPSCRRDVRRSRRKAVYETLVAMHKFSARVRRTGRRARYELLVLTHRLGLRGSNSRNTP